MLDEPSAGLHPADAEPLLRVLDELKAAGNTLFVVEHDMDVVRRADWIVDIGPGAGEHGGQVLYSGPVAGLEQVTESVTGRYLFDRCAPVARERRPVEPWIGLDGVTRNNLDGLSVDLPLHALTAVTGVSGLGQVDPGRAGPGRVGARAPRRERCSAGDDRTTTPTTPTTTRRPSDRPTHVAGVRGLDRVDRLVVVDQRPIGRTPRSNLATYTGLFDAVRRTFAATPEASRRGYGAGQFSFNVAAGRCETCAGEGFVAVELLFLPGTYAPCPTCGGARYNPETLEVTYRDHSVADVLALSVDEAADLLGDVPAAVRGLTALREVGLGYLRLGQPATELSGGEAQRIKLATELQRPQRGHTLYLLDEPTAGLHPEDTRVLLHQLHQLVDLGNTVVLVEHDLDTIASADWVVDLGPGGGDQGGQVVVTGTRRRSPRPVRARRRRTSPAGCARSRRGTMVGRTRPRCPWCVADRGEVSTTAQAVACPPAQGGAIEPDHRGRRHLAQESSCAQQPTSRPCSRSRRTFRTRRGSLGRTCRR